MSIERTLPAHAIMAVVNDLRHGQEITLSDTRLQMRRQDVDPNLVAQLQHAIGQGKLIMDSGRVADALLMNAWQN
ncbi:anti-sigma28 factor FlgM [Sodalis glossinidius str. 'morsitans']|uniref:Anti-sigma28 factor FlgM n=1 Tax=Sodalis glossinidius (strain morsitans) TaxID=343509 RepID=Q2NX22_SODGM|nr:flagellar biosynthesis protein FlgM [Sodalis glossinidius]BAE73303.1 negative regulator of flagellin synthesis FlgM [Sodalis glossinidius str. 'morsitans']CRL43622.1 anti-sigma28 factor FlgM [Sodalis glossinidius str. 'morsitans']